MPGGTDAAGGGVPQALEVLDHMAAVGIPGFPADAGKIIVRKQQELLDTTFANRKEEIAEAAEIRMKYAGYIERERVIADKMHRLEDIRIKGRFDYNSLQSLSTECRQKLIRINPETIAQASRIPGVSPSDINVLLVLLGR